MGMAFYYAKLFFDRRTTDEDAEKVSEFLRKLKVAEDDWQDTRSKDEWPALWERNKEVFLTLGILPELNLKPPMNELAGQLDSPWIDDDWYIFNADDFVAFSGEVWHFADWDDLGQALINLTGAVEFKWLSDEYIEYYDILRRSD